MNKIKHTRDNIIIDRLKKGDASAFRDLVEKYKDVSFSLAYSILKNEQDAEDALQEVFLKVYKNSHQFRADSSFSTWLYRIVVNTCFTACKKADNKIFSDPINNESLEVCTDRKGDEKIILSERKHIINTALNMMKTNESLLLKLYYLADLNTHEIKTITAFSESKIKVTLFRGRKNFHKYLKQILGNELEHFYER